MHWLWQIWIFPSTSHSSKNWWKQSPESTISHTKIVHGNISKLCFHGTEKTIQSSYSDNTLSNARPFVTLSQAVSWPSHNNSKKCLCSLLFTPFTWSLSSLSNEKLLPPNWNKSLSTIKITPHQISIDMNLTWMSSQWLWISKNQSLSFCVILTILQARYFHSSNSILLWKKPKSTALTFWAMKLWEIFHFFHQKTKIPKSTKSSYPYQVFPTKTSSLETVSARFSTASRSKEGMGSFAILVSDRSTKL